MFAISHSRGAKQSARSLRWRFLSLAGTGAVLVLGVVAYAGLLVLQKSIAGDEDARIVNSASLSEQLVQRILSERVRQVQLIAAEPNIIAAAKKGTETSRAKGLPNHSIDDLEQMFKGPRSQQVDENALRYLNGLLPKLDIAEVMLTDEFGYNAVTTSLSSDFVQSDEAWWHGVATARRPGDHRPRDGTNGPSCGRGTRGQRACRRRVVSSASRCSTPYWPKAATWHDTGRPSTPGQGHRQLRTGRASPLRASTVASRSGQRLQLLPDSIRRRGSVFATNGSRWRVVAHMSLADATRAHSGASLFIGSP